MMRNPLKNKVDATLVVYNTSNPFRGESLFARTGPAGQALSPLF